MAALTVLKLYSMFKNNCTVQAAAADKAGCSEHKWTLMTHRQLVPALQTSYKLERPILNPDCHSGG